MSLIERWHLYAGVVPSLIGVGEQITMNNPIRLWDLPGPYSLRQIAWRDDLGTKSIRFRNNRNVYAMNAFAPVNMLGTAQYPLPIRPEMYFPPQSVFAYDVLQTESELTQDLWTVLHGAHLVESAEQLYPANFRESEYTHQVNVTVAANSLQSVPINLWFNTDFAIRALTADVIADTSTFDTTVTLRDHNWQSFSNRDLLWFLMFGRDGANTPVTPSPELVLPAHKAYTLEVRGGAGAGSITLQFNFRGALLNAI